MTSYLIVTLFHWLIGVIDKLWLFTFSFKKINFWFACYYLCGCWTTLWGMMVLKGIKTAASPADLAFKESHSDPRSFANSLWGLFSWSSGGSRFFASVICIVCSEKHKWETRGMYFPTNRKLYWILNNHTNGSAK